MKVALASSDPVEKANKFMQDGVFTEKGDFFDGV